MSDPKNDDDQGGGSSSKATSTLQVIAEARRRTGVLCAIIDDRNDEIDAILTWLSKRPFFDADGKQVWPEQALKNREHMVGRQSVSERNMVARLSNDDIVDHMCNMYMLALADELLSKEPICFMFFESGSFSAEEMIKTSATFYAREGAAGKLGDGSYKVIASNEVVMEDGTSVKLALMTSSYALALFREFAEVSCKVDPEDINQKLATVTPGVTDNAVTVIGLTYYGFSISDYEIPVVAMSRSKAFSGTGRPAAEA